MTINFLNTTKPQIKETESPFDVSILNRISVQKPYFALKNLISKEEYVFADFVTELITSYEVGPIGAAEVGRHMAILGSVVLSKENPKKERHHYLATDALITRCSSKVSTNYKLKSCAKLVSLNRKKGVIAGEIFDADGTTLFTVEVTYMILVKTVFERMFEQHRNEVSFSADFNPYINDAEFFDLEVGMESCRASIGVVKAEHCPGHFKNFPALPVARMGTAMGQIGGIHFTHLNPSEKKQYFISNAELHAKQLVFTGEEVKFRTEIANPNHENGMIIRVVAYTNTCDLVAESYLYYHY